MKKRADLLFVISYCAYVSIYVARVNLSMASPVLREAGMFTSAQLGLLGSVFSVVYALGRILNGTLTDRVPPGRMISCGLLLTGLSNLLIGFLPPYAAVAVLWGANAFAQSMLWSALLCTVSAIYDEQTAKKRCTVLGTVVAAGNIAGIVLNLYLIDAFGARWAFVIPGALTLVMAVLIAVSLRGIPASASDTRQAHVSLPALFKNRELRGVVLPTFFHGVMKDNVTFWMTIYFTDQFGIDLNQSGLFVLLIPVVGLAARMAFPAIYRLCRGNEHRAAQAAFVLCIVPSVLLCIARSSPAAAMVCLSLVYAGASVANSAFLSMFPLRFRDTGNVASVSGVLDFCAYLGTGAASVCYGLLVDRAGYAPMFASWAAISLLSLAILQGLIGREKAKAETIQTDASK